MKNLTIAEFKELMILIEYLEGYEQGEVIK